MNRSQRLKYEMLVRARNFGTVNRDVFPESTGGGQKFTQLATVVASIEEHLVRRQQARAEARKVKAATRRATWDYMQDIAATGRQAVEGEPGAHPFRMPERRAATVVLTTASLFKAEAEKRKEKFVELGMAPTFLEDFAALVTDLAGAIGLQQDSRGAWQKAQAGIEAGLARGAKLIAQLDVTVANALRADLVRLGQWEGVRRIDRPSSGPARTPVTTPSATEQPPAATPAPVEVALPVDPPDVTLKVAS